MELISNLVLSESLISSNLQLFCLSASLFCSGLIIGRYPPSPKKILDNSLNNLEIVGRKLWSIGEKLWSKMVSAESDLQNFIFETFNKITLATQVVILNPTQSLISEVFNKITLATQVVILNPTQSLISEVFNKTTLATQVVILNPTQSLISAVFKKKTLTKQEMFYQLQSILDGFNCYNKEKQFKMLDSKIKKFSCNSEFDINYKYCYNWSGDKFHDTHFFTALVNKLDDNVLQLLIQHGLSIKKQTLDSEGAPYSNKVHNHLQHLACIIAQQRLTQHTSVKDKCKQISQLFDQGLDVNHIYPCNGQKTNLLFTVLSIRDNKQLKTNCIKMLFEKNVIITEGLMTSQMIQDIHVLIFHTTTSLIRDQHTDSNTKKEKLESFYSVNQSNVQNFVAFGENNYKHNTYVDSAIHMNDLKVINTLMNFGFKAMSDHVVQITNILLNETSPRTVQENVQEFFFGQKWVENSAIFYTLSDIARECKCQLEHKDLQFDISSLTKITQKIKYIPFAQYVQESLQELAKRELVQEENIQEENIQEENIQEEHIQEDTEFLGGVYHSVEHADYA